MAQPSLNLPPASRQDIISALLNDYGNSFGVGDSSPYKYSPVPTPKDLPPTPPEKERSYNNDKPLPPVGHMSMRFQLRVDDPSSPTSPDGSRSSMESQPKRIVSRRLTRSSKPPSLKLTVSNGSTAIVPPTPSLPFQPAPIPSSQPREEEKSLPPPPPEKSERRQQQQVSMENTSSAERPPRKDSLQSQASETAGPMKRKPLPKFTSLAQLGNGPRGGKGGPLPPAPRSRKQSFDDGEEQGSKGRSASAAQASRSRKQSLDDEKEQASNPRSFSAIETKIADDPSTRSPKPFPNPAPIPPPKSLVGEETAPRVVAPVANQLPPTPDENPLPAPPPPKKPFAGMGLPSNPRAKAQQHSRGKSSTGFNFMKSSKAVSGPQAPVPETITPGPTPSPRKTEEVQQTQVPSPVPLVQENDQRRPFSFEAVQSPPPPPPPPRKDSEILPAPAPAKPLSPVSPMESQNTVQDFTPRSPSRPPPAFASLPSQQGRQQQQRSAPPPPPTNSSRPPPAFAALPSQQRKQQQEDNEPAATPTNPSSQQRPPTPPTDPVPSNEAPASPPPFTPLTKHPISRPAPPLTTKHLTCYSHHSSYVWSKNTFQPMACMVCKANDRERMWACVWCYLRVCVPCSAELMKMPRRDLKGLLEKRGVDVEIEGEVETRMGEMQARKEEMKRHDSGTGGSVGTPTVVVWGAE